MMKSILLILLITSGIGVVQVSAQTKEKLYAVFMLNFSQKMQWPSDKVDGEFVIGTLNESEVSNELKLLSKTKSVGGLKIVVKEFNHTDEIGFCHILFIPHSQSGKLPSIVSNIPDSPTVIVTEKTGSCKKGSAINFLEVDNKLRFELNVASLEKRNIKVSNELKLLGLAPN